MLSSSQYNLISGSSRLLQGGEPLTTSSGIAISGGYIYNSLAAGNEDAVEDEARTLDVCLSHPTGFGEFHYHYWSACIKKNEGFSNDSTAPALCKDSGDCTSDTAVYTRSSGAFTAENWDDVIGIARDGHVIIGPYKSDGTTWGCDRDVCNGAFIDGQYVYVGSDNFPYVVGCWGPGPDPAFAPTCSNSGCSARGVPATSNNSSNADMDDSAQNLIIAATTTISITMAFLF